MDVNTQSEDTGETHFNTETERDTLLPIVKMRRRRDRKTSIFGKLVIFCQSQECTNVGLGFCFIFRTQIIDEL